MGKKLLSQRAWRYFLPCRGIVYRRTDSKQSSWDLSQIKEQANLEEPTHYIDIIEHPVNPLKSKFSKIAEMLPWEGVISRSDREGAGISKTAVLERLHTLGIRNAAFIGERMTNPNNYRASVVPYGYRKVDGQLGVDKKEIRGLLRFNRKHINLWLATKARSGH